MYQLAYAVTGPVRGPEVRSVIVLLAELAHPEFDHFYCWIGGADNRRWVSDGALLNCVQLPCVMLPQQRCTWLPC